MQFVKRLHQRVKPLQMKKLLSLICCFVALSSFAQTDSLANRLQGVMACGIVRNHTKPVLMDTQLIRKPDQALFVVDGIAYEASAIENLDFGEIKTISVLKDANTLFSCRRLADVIIITTRKEIKPKIIVVDETDGTPIIGATIEVKSNGERRTFSSTKEGAVLSLHFKKQPYDLTVTNVGYQAKQQVIRFDTAHQVMTISLKRKVKELEKVTISAGYREYRTLRCGGCGTTIKRCLVHTVEKRMNEHNNLFAIYPNPASTGTNIIISVKQNIQGPYQIISVAGQLVRSGTLNQSNGRSFALSTLGLKAGTYFLQLYVSDENRFVAQKIILQ